MYRTSGAPIELQLPPEDRESAPFTGWTRAHWEAVADHWLLGLRPHTSPGHAAVLPPASRLSVSGRRSDGLEGFARSFLAASARIAGARGADPENHAEWYAAGLAAAVEPGGPEAWAHAADTRRAPVEGPAQPIVEASAVAFGLALSREWLWDRLDEGVRQRLGAWLAHHASLQAWDNNWLLFTAITEAFCDSAGIPVARPHAEADVERVESWYLGDGWYNDGPLETQGRALDHYNSWVIHPYLWMWYRLRGDRAPADRRARYRERLAAFAGSYSRLFAPDGSPLFLGRSLAYRTAVLAGPWAAALEGVSPLAPGATRRLASGTMRYFTDRGAGSTGPLALGWTTGEYLPMVQGYSGPGSPYWAGIGMLGLSAPADHPLWTEPEQPQPSERNDTPATVALPDLGWLVATSRRHGVVRVVNHGTDHTRPGAAAPTGEGYGPVYARLGYTTHTSPGFGQAWSDGADGHLALVDAWERATTRGAIGGFAVRGEDVAASWHQPFIGGRALPGARVVTASVLHADAEVRCHLVDAPEGWTVREGGTLVATEAAEKPSLPAGGAAWAGDDRWRSVLAPLAGWSGARAETLPYGAVTPLGGGAEVPVLWAAGRPEGGRGVHVSVHALG
ncbi:hypothetical protein BIV57_22655, partial [Mangrovactinospora gilvigrisea]